MNEILSSALLGVVQGFTEFLPISSSGHLVIFQSLLKFNEPGILFEAILHMGTIFSVVWYFRDYLKKITANEIKLLVIGTIPAGIVGVLFKSQVEALFDSTKLVGIAFLFTAGLNYFMDKRGGKKTEPDTFDAILIGLAQAFAIIPGISRSGSTIFAGKSLKLDSYSAARFSFLLSIPAILGANVVQIASHGLEINSSYIVYFVGFIASFVTGILSIKILIDFLQENRMKLFSVYLVIVGLATILLF